MLEFEGLRNGGGVYPNVAKAFHQKLSGPQADNKGK
jgi:hypothetical protein